MKGKYNREDCIKLLEEKQAYLMSVGENRYPKRDDFTDEEVCAIKAYLGPWPRALETAGLKPPRNDAGKEKNRQKRIRAKRNRIAAKKAENTDKKY